jgi:hypothetical protein
MWVFSMPILGNQPMTGSPGLRRHGEASDLPMRSGFSRLPSRSLRARRLDLGRAGI